jgi:hypothetical protein
MKSSGFGKILAGEFLSVFSSAILVPINLQRHPEEATGQRSGGVG